MNHTDIVKQFHHAIENGDMDALRSLIADDFVFDHGAMEGTMDKQRFIQAMTALQRGVPDLRFNLAGLQGEGTVRGNAHLTGTHTATLDLSVIDGPNVESTGKSFDNPIEPVTWEVRDGKVAKHAVQEVEGGGIHGILQQLGIGVTH